MPQRDLVSWNVMLSAFAKSGHFLEALDLFRSFPERNIVTWNTLFSAFESANLINHVLEAFHAMPERNTLSWNAVLAAFAQSGHIESAKQLFDAMPDRDMVSWTTLLCGFSRVGDVKSAEECFKGMPFRNLVSWNAMLSVYVQAGEITKAEIMFEEMLPERGVVAWTVMLGLYIEHQGEDSTFKDNFLSRMPVKNIVSWNLVLVDLAQKRKLHEANCVFDSMPEWNLVAWNAMLMAFSQEGDSGNLENATILFRAMPCRSLISCTTMLVGFVQHRKLEQAKCLFDHGMPYHDAVSWNAMLAAYNQGQERRNLLELTALFVAMPEKDMVSWTQMVVAYGQKGCLASSLVLFQQMPEKKDSTAWNAMLTLNAQAGNFEQTFGIYNEMAMDGSRPDEVSFSGILLACSHCGDLKVAKLYFASMLRDHCLVATKEQYGCLVDLLSRAGHLGDARDLIASMPFVPESGFLTSFVRACQGLSDVEAGNQIAEKAILGDPGSDAPYVLKASIFQSKGG
ncbi:pentatricopeptide repeat-containing protein At4g02750-like [Selaginella moellendorffii]|uniref:pentatricopeptide repeat-containing protein At4g02750-like n=1 Tax=Selaginella moellendorffii TaxID=88036 RepID=UPI000D1CA7BF|nr:pentatricopeptide repeat-containing protein At4g02750-like [Selaginella moellendorffii]|eukprot:XP_024538674.1 pentatricopeptide repeat-containing protein At4g02750-like [Selaginella moellendorffii]